jgi:hypothetical protein
MVQPNATMHQVYVLFDHPPEKRMVRVLPHPPPIPMTCLEHAQPLQNSMML